MLSSIMSNSCQLTASAAGGRLTVKCDVAARLTLSWQTRILNKYLQVTHFDN